MFTTFRRSFRRSEEVLLSSIRKTGQRLRVGRKIEDDSRFTDKEGGVATEDYVEVEQEVSEKHCNEQPVGMRSET